MQITINYKDSGAKTLQAFAGISFIFAILLVVGSVAFLSKLAIVMIIFMIVVAFFLAVLGALCLGVSTIAKTALMKRLVFEGEHQFIEAKK